MNTCLFYDIETTGLNRAFDQVLSFSAIRTDLALTELEQHTMDIRLRADVIPSPQAMIVNRIDLNAFSSAHRELVAITEIHRLFNRPGTISLGYNTLGFDDEFLRFSFYRNLLPPYTHQFKNDCRRMDIYPITLFYYLFKPEALTWPEKNGKPSLKLDNLSRANHLAEGPAHDAMVDTAATLALARRLARHEKIWQYVSGYFDKTVDQERIDALPIAFQSAAGPHRLGLMVDGGIGTDASFLAPVISLGQSTPYRNQTLWLRLDLPELTDTTTDTLAENTWVFRKKLGEPGFILPPLPRYWQRVDPERQAVIEKNQRWLQTGDSLLLDIVRYHREFRYPEVPDVDPDAALYETGFMSKPDTEICRQFHAADVGKKEALAGQLTAPVYRQLARRLLARNFPEDVSGRLTRRFNQYLKQVHPATADAALVDYRGQRRRTPMDALKGIAALREQADAGDIRLDAAQKDILAGLETYLKDQFKL